MEILKTISEEVKDYLYGEVELSEGVKFSEYKLKKRIMYFKTKTYPTGKITPDGDYEFWFDLIMSCVNDEIKNIDFDSKHVLLFSKNPVGDFPAVYTANLYLSEWMWENGKAEEINAVVEDYSGDGNVLFRKTAKGYEVWDMLNTIITNTTARTVDDTDIIQRFYLTQAELRAFESNGLYKNVEDVIKECGNKWFSKTEKGIGEEKTKLMYELYRRDGQVSEAALFEAQGKKGGRSDHYLLARIIVAGLRYGSNNNAKILFAEELPGKMSDYYIEAHRGPYKGKWFREGMYELLMDHQIRYNDITNQIARGLEWASKVLFRHNDIQTLQNLRSALDNGGLIKSESLQQVEVRLQGFDQLVADRNAVIQDARRIANSSEIVQGGEMPAQTPAKLASLQNFNSNKLYALLRQKLTIPYKRVFREYVIKQLVKDLKAKDVIRVTGDVSVLDEFRKMQVNTWYVNNLAKIGPHDQETAEMIKTAKLQELQGSDPMIENMREIWVDILPRLQVTITGENYLVEETETIQTLIQYEKDPSRLAHLLDIVYASKGIPLPKTTTAAAQSTQEPKPTADTADAQAAQRPEPATA